MAGRSKRLGKQRKIVPANGPPLGASESQFRSSRRLVLKNVSSYSTACPLLQYTWLFSFPSYYFSQLYTADGCYVIEICLFNHSLPRNPNLSITDYGSVLLL